MDAYRPEELRFVAEFSQASAVAGTSIDTTTFVVPSNTIRTILYASLSTDIGEARNGTFKIIGNGVVHAVRSWAWSTNNGSPIAILQEGNEIRLLPGDRLRLDRDVATAGSTMTLYVRYIDTIMPFQTFQDPYNPARRKSNYLPNPGGGGYSGPASGGTGPGTSPGSGGTGGGVPPMV